jgi:hypothetical protein
MAFTSQFSWLIAVNRSLAFRTDTVVNGGIATTRLTGANNRPGGAAAGCWPRRGKLSLLMLLVGGH